MTAPKEKSIPSYLRLHQDQKSDPSARPLSASKARRQPDPIADFWYAYDLAQGWRVDAAHPSRASDTAATTKPTSFAALANAATQLATSYQESLDALRRQEAELAAYAFSTDTATEGCGGVLGQSLYERLQHLLQQATTACGCTAAALYTLDDETTLLKTRAVVGLPANHLLQETRALRGSRGDLEALVNDVVVIDDLAGALATTWNSPADFPSAMIVKLEQDDLPVGTLWFWSSEARSFTAQDAAAAGLSAIAIAAELSKVRGSRKQAQGKQSRESIRAVTQWQMRQMPPAMELAPGCVVDGWAESPQNWACSWHAWDVLPDGRVSLALAQAEETQLDGAMVAATARAALTAHSHYRHTAADMLSRVSDSLWATNTGDQLLSLLYAQWDPESGEGQLASAGSMQAIIVGKRGYRPLVHGNGSPLLASSPDARWTSHDFRLQPGEALVAVNAAVLDSLHGISQTRWAKVAREALGQPSSPILAAIRRQLADKQSPWEHAGVVLHRHEQTVKGFRPAAPR